MNFYLSNNNNNINTKNHNIKINILPNSSNPCVYVILEIDITVMRKETQQK